MGKSNRDALKAKAKQKSKHPPAASSSGGDAAAPKAAGPAAKRKKGGKQPGGGGFFGDPLERELAAVGLRVAKITGDGNCLFRSIGDQLEVRADGRKGSKPQPSSRRTMHHAQESRRG
jgi:OTU domain-containing protein 3